MSIGCLKKPSKNYKKHTLPFIYNKKSIIVKIMRIFDIIKTELLSDKLKHEEEIERVINNKNLETNDKVATIKTLLSVVAMIDASILKFNDYISVDVEEEKIIK